MERWLLVAAAYLSGSIPFGLLASQALGGVDVRRYGSGNIGTANVLRTVGKKAAAFTLAGDILKGFVPVLVARLLGVPEAFVLLVGLAAIVGHDWSLFLSFKGGKGVATSFGVLFGVLPSEALIGLFVWILIAFLSRYTSLAALVVAVVVPAIVAVEDGLGPHFTFCLVIAFLIFTKHRENIKRLLKGTEHRVGQKVR